MTQTFYERTIPAAAPDKYKQAAYEAGRREAGMKLYDALWREKNPAIVEIEEEIFKPGYHPTADTSSYYHRADIFRIRIKITMVEHRRVTLTHGYNGLQAWSHPPTPILTKIKWTLRRYWRRLFT